ncbi:hypothetical protein ACFLZT_02625 [Thermodesulfobacteriota bacterium]
MTITEYETRFGTVAVDKGFITAQQLKQALEIQAAEVIETKEHRLIGQILFDLNMIRAPHIDEILNSLNNF